MFRWGEDIDSRVMDLLSERTPENDRAVVSLLYELEASHL